MTGTPAPDRRPNRLGIVGATGWLGQGVGLNLLQKGLWSASDLVILNRSGQMGGYADHPGVILARHIDEMQALCGTIILSVRPEDFPLPGFAPGNCLLISFMAAVPMARLAALAPEARIVRAMPNGGATSGTSYTPWLSGALDAKDVALTRRILSAMGDEDRVESEDHLDILTALSGSGPAYPALMARALHRQALALGLPAAIAERAVASVVCGSAAGLRVTEADRVIAAMMSYRGITAAGLQAAQEAGFEAALEAALTAAVARARAMGH
ncbi:pyrroline-5-carboxylate reductase dimerization domain-containing protein [Paracoccaceae bacterium]